MVIVNPGPTDQAFLAAAGVSPPAGQAVPALLAAVRPDAGRFPTDPPIPGSRAGAD